MVDPKTTAPTPDERMIIESADWQGEAAERVARCRGISFGAALTVVNAWMAGDQQ